MSTTPLSADERDYTDGASAQDIQNVIRETHRRGESQVGGSYQPRRSMSSFRGDEEDTGGAIFDGPGSVTIPSSVTGLRSARARSFNTESRRGSRIYRARSIDDQQSVIRPDLRRQGTFQSGDTAALDASDDDGGSPTQERRGRRRRMSTDERGESPVLERPRRTSIFGGFSSFFGRRESPSRKSNVSLSRADSIDYTESPLEEEDDRWGYHSSEEEDASVEDVASVHGSFYPASSRGSQSRPASPSHAFPGLGRDPIFGDVRIDMEEASLAESLPQATGPPIHQDIYIADEDLKLRLLGYRTSRSRIFIWRSLTVCSLGAVGLLGHWFPQLWLWFTAEKSPFHDRKTNLVVVENSSQDIIICWVEAVPYPYSHASTFPDPAQSIPTVSNGGTTRPSSVIKMTTFISPVIVESISPDQELKVLRMFEYRYNRYLLDPRTGLWFMA
ncbi:hypothetical protein FRC17_008770, partial [Serendipita sp. 399]